MLTICQHAKHGRNFNLAEKHSFMKARFAHDRSRIIFKFWYEV